MSVNFRTPRQTPSSFQNYFYQIKPFLRRPSTPSPISRQFFPKTTHKDLSFHLTSKKGPNTPKCCTFDLRQVNTEFDALSSGRLTFKQNPQSRLETEYQSNGSTNQNDSGPILHIDYNSPVQNIKKAFRENLNRENERSPSLVECETEESSIRTTENKEGKSFRKITGRDLSIIRLEEKSVQEYIGTVQARIRKVEEEEKSVKKKIEITKKFEDKIFEKRRKIENCMRDLNSRKMDDEKLKNTLKQKNQLEKKLHQENLNKTKNKIVTVKQQKALKVKEEKENFMEKANLKKELDFSEKIIKVNGVLNFEKKLKSKKISNCSQKGIEVQNGLLNQFQAEQERLSALRQKALELEKQETISKEKLEEMKQLHMIKFFKLQQMFENKENFGPNINYKGYTNASTATFDECKSGKSEIRNFDVVNFDDRRSGLSSPININTSVITLVQRKNN